MANSINAPVVKRISYLPSKQMFQVRVLAGAQKQNWLRNLLNNPSVTENTF